MIAFAGRKFYLDKATGYYKTDHRKPDRRYLHREIYSATYGNIPHGWQVHHTDENPGNNDIANLAALPMRDHVHRAHKITAQCEQCGAGYTRRRIGSNRWCSTGCSTAWHNAQRYV
jgi:hypothetical protein